MSLKELIKVANYYQVKYNFEVTAQSNSKPLDQTNQSEYLRSLVQTDQDTRNEWKKRMDESGGWSEDLAAQYADEKGTSPDDLFGERQRLEKFTQYKFNFDTFSKDDWNNYWLLAQHCDFNLDFQKSALKNIERYLGRNSKEFQYLTDRILCAQNKPQIYGTQNTCGT